MDSTKSLARRAGLLYVLASSPAPFAYLYVPDALIVQGDALATADRVRASEDSHSPQKIWFTENLQILGVGEMPYFSFYLLIWGVRGHAVDRLAALLVLLSFAIGTAAVGLLLLKRIDTTQYAALALASLVVVFGLVMRWRMESSAEARI